MTDSNSRNGKVLMLVGAGAFVTIAGWGYADIKSELREARVEISTIRAIQAVRGERVTKLEAQQNDTQRLERRIEALERMTK